MLSLLKKPLASMLLNPLLPAVLKPDVPLPNLFPPNLEPTPLLPKNCVCGLNCGTRGNAMGLKLKLKDGTRGTWNGRKEPRLPTPLLKLPPLLNVCPVPVVKEVVLAGRLLKRVLVVKAVPPPPGPPAEAEDDWKVAQEPRPTVASRRVRCRMEPMAVNREHRVSDRGE